MERYRAVILDLENFPVRGFAWTQREKYPTTQNLIDVDRPWNIASFAWKFEGDKGKPQCLALPDFPRAYKKNPFDDYQLLLRLHAILDEADLVIGHNVRSFDLRKTVARLIKYGIRPPSPYRVYDTLTEARSLGMFPSNKLGDLAKYLGCPLGGKIEHEGFALWLKCMAGDSDAWDRMIRYNIQDVAINQWVYHKLRPWSKSHPNITILSGKSLLCPVCGSRTKRAGWNNLKTYRSQRYECLAPNCGRFSSGPREKLLATVLS